MSLQVESFMRLWDLLSIEVQDKVLEKQLSMLPLEKILNHPGLIEQYREEILKRPRIDNGSRTEEVYMIKNIKSCECLKQLYDNGGVFVYPFNGIKYCYKTNDKLILISEYHYNKNAFDLSGYTLELFDMYDHIINCTYPLEQVFWLVPHHFIPNPEWAPVPERWKLPQCIPVGQTEVVWWYEF